MVISPSRGWNQQIENLEFIDEQLCELGFRYIDSNVIYKEQEEPQTR